MKRFYRCPICGSEFCLKGRKYCEEGGGVYCGGQSKKHEQILMDYAGDTIESLRVLRKKHKAKRAIEGE